MIGKLDSLRRWVELNLPDGREKALTLTKLDEARFWALAAIGASE